MALCYQVSEIYGLSGTKALAFELGLTYFSDVLNATAALAEGWLTTDDNLLLEEKVSKDRIVRQPTTVVKTFVHHNYFVVHTNLPFENWCTNDCGCVKKGYFGFDDPQGLAAESATTSFLKNGGLLISIVVLPLLCVACSFCTIRYRRLKKVAMYREAEKRKAAGEGKDPSKQSEDFDGPVRAHRPPPTPPGSSGGFGADQGQGRIGLGDAGRMVLAAHRLAPMPPSAQAAAAQAAQAESPAITWLGDRQQAAPRNMWGAAQNVLRAQSALAMLQQDASRDSLPPVAPPHAQSFPGMQMPVFSPGMQMTPEAAAMARYAASPPGARITEE